MADARIPLMMNVGDIVCTVKVLCPQSAPFRELLDSIARDGMRIPVYINNRREVIFGHYRFLAAAELGIKAVPIRFAEDPKKIDLSKEG